MTIHLIRTARADDSNIYLVTGKQPLVVDAGTGAMSDYVISEIDRLSDAPPAAIVVTHCHFDHAGGLADLVERYGCKVYAGCRDAPYIRSPDSKHTVAGLFDSVMRPVSGTVDLKEGDILDTGDHRFTVLETPGHTEGSICLFEESSGVLISGDTVFSNGYGRTDFPGGSARSMVDSLLRLSKMDIRGLFPGHGSTSEDFGPDDIVDVLRMAGV